MSLFEHGYALIVGVGGDLQASVADATDLASVLKDPLRAAYKAENVILLTEAAATRDGVVAGLHRLRDMTKADPQATAVIYFSGHGIVVGEKTPTPKYFLATHGHDFDRPAETCLSDEDFSKAIDEVLAQKKIVFLDCCHAAGIPKSKGDGAVETALPKKTLQQLTGGEGTVVVASCGHKQKSWEYPGSRNSLFTEVLLEELGVGDETDGLAYMFGVLNEVTKRVRARGGDKYPQEPLVAYAKGLTNFPICRGKWGAKGGVGQPAGTAPKKSKGADTARSVFVSYAQADKAYGEELVRTLRTYERAGVFRLIPHDVDPGKVVELEVRRKVEEAGVIVCLLSADYFADNRMSGVEQPAIEGRGEGAILLPVQLRAFAGLEVAWPSASRLPRFPATGSVAASASRAEVWAELSQQILDLFQARDTRGQSSGAPPAAPEARNPAPARSGPSRGEREILKKQIAAYEPGIHDKIDKIRTIREAIAVEVDLVRVGAYEKQIERLEKQIAAEQAKVEGWRAQLGED